MNHYAPLKFVLTLLLVLSWCIASSQDTTLQIKKWIHNLSVKDDPRFALFYEVHNDIYKLPKDIQCSTIAQIEGEGPGRNKRFHIRTIYLKAYLDTELDICPEIPDDLLKTALRQAYELEDDVLIAELNDFLCWHYTLAKDFNSAVLHGLIARDMQLKLGIEHFASLYTTRYRLAYALYHSHDYANCIAVAKEALNWPELPYALADDSLSILSQLYTWNTLGLSYLKLNYYDSAFFAFKKSLEVNEHVRNVFWNGLIKGNIGDTYFQMGQYDSAAAYLAIDIETSITAGELDNAANSMQWMARIKAEKNPAEALAILRKASQYLEVRPQSKYHANTLYAYTQVFAELGKADSVNNYMKKYLKAQAELDNEVNNSRIDIMRLRMENQAGVYQIISLNKEKKRILLLRNFLILTIVLGGALGYLFLHREWLKMRLRQQQALQEKRKAEADVQASHDQLKIFTENLLEKTQLVETLQAQLLEKELVPPPLSEDDFALHTILTDEEWEKFKHLFERVYPGFFNSLKHKTPEITTAELRMAALLRLQIPARKSATILGISQNSVYKTRQRLRHRLGLETDGDLAAYFEIKQD